MKKAEGDALTGFIIIGALAAFSVGTGMVFGLGWGLVAGGAPIVVPIFVRDVVKVFK